MAMGELRAGKDLIAKAAENNGKKGNVGGYTPFFSWKQGDMKSIFFVTPLNEVPKVLMHEFVRKYVTDANGVRKERWLTFMCRKDPAWKAESNNYCPLCDEIGHKAVERFISVAVEVEPVYNGKRLDKVNVKYNTGTDKDGNEAEYPAVGLVMKGPKFFGTLVALDQKRGDISELSWEITRQGTGLKTEYIFDRIDDMPSLEEIKDSLPNLNDLLHDLGSEEKYDRDFEGITADDQPSFGDDKVGAKKNTPVSRSTGSQEFEELKSKLDSAVGAY